MDNTSHKLNCFNLASELTELRNSSAYQQMRVEINRRNNPLSGGTDWEKVYQLALQISSGLGADLLTSAYFVTAASKTRGVSGLASGLDLMLSVISFSSELTQLPNEKVSEIINWAVTKVTPEIKKMAVTSSNVREWYRCEHACQKLFELITQKQPQQVPNLDALGYLIFEKIDLLETNKVGGMASTTLNTAPVKVKNTRWLLWTLSSLIIICSLLSSYLSVAYHQQVSEKLPLWLYQEPEKELETSIAQRIDQVFSLAQGEPLISIYPEQVNLLVELDKNYQRFTNVRTSMANLRLLSQALPDTRDKVKQEAQSIAQYASSLSPILGRAYYIGDLLDSKEYGRAKAELNQLDSHIKALLIKRTLLVQQLHNQMLTESDTQSLELSSQYNSGGLSPDGGR
ncbi:type VI secretion system ImpA family N-terminal domain-containing protein [Shewanella sp. MMG014]|uniref:type VI secretion system ImpA family N-terminal domain-containing protein n=1 Tax=Shewanella sp. MMG014 TaxID=2822691 RepID=UPI001B36DFA1|nr:type VI secretion system ImpA family N-terminal domain-containing protein [Shewanella sp. MMG014]MBQ4892192.1 type VI secretion system ImpA family N-terminal domain-containing protein [Shewanella sp. MMG014]